MSLPQLYEGGGRVPTMPVKVGAAASAPTRGAPTRPTATKPTPQPTAAGAAAAAAPVQTTVTSYSVRLQRNAKKLYSIMKFSGQPVDFAKAGPVKMERENNYKDFRLAHDIDLHPKFGAGSEFGRQQRDEARRKKYGMATRKYSPYSQPWLMRAGTGKNARKFKGTKEGGITENASYFMFMQIAAGCFEACPIDDWYTFNPTIKYKFLNSDEAEEEFSRRDKNLNLRSIMLKKRLKGEDGLDEEEEAELKGKKPPKKKKDRSGLKLTEMEDWNDDEEDSADGSDDSDGEKKKKSKDAPKKRRNRGGKANSDNEAMEESDDANEGAEVDYMTSSDSEEEMMFDKDKLQEKDTYDEKGVAEEEGLLTLIDSGAEDEEEEEKKDENEDEDEENEEKKEKKSKKDPNDSDSMSSSSSDSDSEVDESKINSALLLGTKKADKEKGSPDKASPSKKKQRRPSLSSEGSAATNSRSATPSVDQGDGESGKARSATDSPVPKKPRLDTPTLPSGSSEGITDDAVRRYLMRKPMTTKDILQKFKSKKIGMTNEQMVHAITQALKRINPERQKVKDKLYLHLKKS